MLLSSLYKKPIIDSHSAQNLGEIQKIHILNTKIDYVMSTSDTKVAVCTITKISDAIMIERDGRNYPNFNFFSIANQLVTDEKGKIYGKLKDILINKDFEIKKLITDSKNLSNIKIVSMSESSIVFERIKKPKTATTLQSIAKVADPTSIVTTITNYNFLIDRVVQKTICSHGNILFPIGKKITKQDIDTAVKHGKLIDLTLYSKFYNVENL